MSGLQDPDPGRGSRFFPLGGRIREEEETLEGMRGEEGCFAPRPGFMFPRPREATNCIDAEMAHPDTPSHQDPAFSVRKVSHSGGG